MSLYTAVKNKDFSFLELKVFNAFTVLCHLLSFYSKVNYLCINSFILFLISHLCQTLVGLAMDLVVHSTYVHI